MTTYQNLTDHELIIPNIGVVSPQGTIETEIELNSANLKPITNQQIAAPAPTPSIQSAPAPQPVQAAPELPQEGEQ